MSIPYLTKQGSKTILKVNDKPFVLLAGEVHNSDSSSIAYMEKIHQVADNLGMNTLLLPVTWEMVEPEEGKYDFSIVKDLILQARRYNRKIVFLWFGSWKNAEMMYCPAWVKTDTKRFERAEIVKGESKAGREISPNIPFKFPYYSISYLCDEAKKADAKVFAKLMEYIKSIDENENTVIAVQVENETGLLGNSREVSDKADAAFNSNVPEEFVKYMKEHTSTMVEDVKNAVLNGKDSGTWKEVFGDVAEEIFSAYYISSFVEYVANKGKEVYPLPLAVNCWLDKGGKPGSYPSGGPVSRVHEVWDYCAPSIGIYSPDIYVPNFDEICSEYVRRGRPLFIPESATHSYCAPRLAYTVGHYHAVCYSPFGFDDIGHPFTAVQGFLFGMDVTDPALKTPQDANEYGTIGKYLNALMPEIGKQLGTNNLDAAIGEKADQSRLIFNDLMIMTGFKSQINPRTDGCLLVVKVNDNEAYLLGSHCSAIFMSINPTKKNFDLLLCEEYILDENDNMVKGRILNGDEVAQFSFDAPVVKHIKYNIY